MKKYVFVLIFFMFVGSAFGADTALDAMTADASPTADDIIYVMNAPGSTKDDRKVTFATLWAYIAAQISTNGIEVAATADGPQLIIFLEATGNGSNYGGVGVPAAVTNSYVTLLPGVTPAAGQTLVAASPANVTGWDAVERSAAQLSWTYPGESYTPVTDDPDNFAANFTGKNLYGGTFKANAAGTAVLPEPAVGMNFTYILTAAQANIIDPLGTGTADTIMMNGLDAAADENITSSTLGAECVIQYDGPNRWLAHCHGFAEATPP